METYRLNSKVVDENNEFLIKTTNDISNGMVSSEIYVNGLLADSLQLPHPEHFKPEEVLRLVESTHDDKKSELETLINAYRESVSSGNIEMVYQIGLAFYYKNLFAKAVELFKAAIALNNNYHQAYHYLAQSYLSSGEIDSSIQAASKAVNLRPEYADYRNTLGECFLAGKKYQNSIEQFEKAIGINLYYSDAYFNYGLALLLNALEKQETKLFSNFLSKSLDNFNKASLINAEYRTSDYDKGLLALEKHDIESAFKSFKSVREYIKETNRQKASPFYMKYALHPNWINEESLLSRVAYLKKEIKKNPTYVDLYIELAQCYLTSSQINWQKALSNYKKAIELNPSMERVSNDYKEIVELSEKINFIMKKIRG